jgi:hypothetical protein
MIMSLILYHFLKVPTVNTVTMAIKFQLEFWRGHANHTFSCLKVTYSYQLSLSEPGVTLS